jgi:hypothetical protein
MDKKPEDTYGSFWQYLSQTQQDLLLEGDYLLNELIRNHTHRFKDYSFLVFPSAKAFEGYLKRIFLDVGFISHLDYISNHLRLGKLMSPNLVEKLGDRSLYFHIREVASVEFADRVWHTWTLGRNEVFHYYPHNIKMISYERAEEIINEITQTMEEIYKVLRNRLKKHDRSEKIEPPGNSS